MRHLWGDFQRVFGRRDLDLRRVSGSRFGDCLHQGEGMRRPGENREQCSQLGVKAGEA